jgi:hypothetical protein
VLLLQVRLYVDSDRWYNCRRFCRVLCCGLFGVRSIPCWQVCEQQKGLLQHQYCPILHALKQAGYIAAPTPVPGWSHCVAPGTLQPLLLRLL